jgi:urea transport system substrate-binding protein
MARDVVEIAFVVPRSGPAGIVGPSCEACGQLATDEINAAGGLLGRELRLRVVDGGRRPAVVAREVGTLVAGGAVEGITGWHISAVRQVVAPIVSGRVPYVYSPLYEGGERTPGVFLAGETPDRQLLPALTWLARELGVRTWCVVGDDYVWPIASARVARDYARRCPEIDIVDEVFVPLGTIEFGAAVRRVERSGAHGVLMLLVGSDAVSFNRAFAAAGLDAACVRFSPLMEENMVLATGADATRELYASAGFFEALPTASGLDFSRRYTERFGVQAARTAGRAGRQPGAGEVGGGGRRPGLRQPPGHGPHGGEPPRAERLPGAGGRARSRRGGAAGALTEPFHRNSFI